jgi:hypothetical protein
LRAACDKGQEEKKKKTRKKEKEFAQCPVQRKGLQLGGPK